jgi:threonine dehydrogenase-like Zn-dependent dehydrogenase
MKAVVFHGVGDIRMEDVAEPKIKEPNDAIVRLTSSAICGTDLHMIRGTMPGMRPGTILGHEGVGVIEEVGKNVRNLNVGDRVVIPSTIACGFCSYCRDGYYAQCETVNPSGKMGATGFFGGPVASMGGLDGLQAEFARVPWANVGLVKLPDDVRDDQAILCSDIFPTGWQGATMAEVKPGRTVAVFGCGPVGLFTIASLMLQGAGRVFAVDKIPSRLEMARKLGAEVIDFSKEDPVTVLKDLTGGIGPDRVIDAVGVDATKPDKGPALKSEAVNEALFKEEVDRVAPKKNPKGDNWHPGDAPSLALTWCVESVAKAGTISIIGVYPELAKTFPIGAAMMKNLTLRMGNCNHRKYLPHLIELVRTGAIDPTEILTQSGPLVGALEAYQHFDRRAEGWIKVQLEPQTAPSVAA